MAGLIPTSNNRWNNLSIGQFDNVVDNYLNNMWYSTRNLFNETFKMDVKDQHNQYVIEAEMPGIKKNEVSLDLNNGQLIISVNKVWSNNQENANYIHKERQVSSVQRTVYLADVAQVSEGNINAVLEDGLLIVTIPKMQQVNSGTRINIQ